MINSNGVDEANQPANSSQPARGSNSKVWISVIIIVVLAVVGYFLASRSTGGLSSKNAPAASQDKNDGEVENSEKVFNK